MKQNEVYYYVKKTLTCFLKVAEQQQVWCMSFSLSWGKPGATIR